MCLISKNLPHSVNYPIKVYKIIENRMGKPYMPYQKYAYHSFPILSSDNTFPPFSRNENYEYGFGFIHAYIEKEKAIEEMNRLNNIIGSKTYNIYEGEIPSGINFAVSEDLITICARKIILKLNE